MALLSPSSCCCSPYRSPLILLLLVLCPLCIVSAPLVVDRSSTQQQRIKMTMNGSEAEKEVLSNDGSPAVLRHPPSTSPIGTSSPLAVAAVSSSSSSVPHDSSSSARLLCQFFIFSTLFGSVCTVSACTCLFHTRRSISQQRRVVSAEDASISRLNRIREPFGPDKPYCLKFDEKGLCYASPLTREVPPLPSYEDACKMLSLAELMANCAETKQRTEAMCKKY